MSTAATHLAPDGAPPAWVPRALGVGLGLGVALAIGLSMYKPGLGLLVPAAGLAFWVWRALLRRPGAYFASVVLFFAYTADFDRGLQLDEVAFALYWALYMVSWFALYGSREVQLRDTQGWLLICFLVALPVFAVLGILNGGRGSGVFNELVNYSMFSIYFPVRHLCRRYPDGVKTVLLSLIAMGVIVAVRNVVLFYSVVTNATELWKISRGRIAANEMVLFSSAVAATTLTVHATRWLPRLLFAAATTATAVGLVLTQYRTYYVAYALALGLIWLVMHRAGRLRLAGLVLTALVGGSALIMAVFPDLAPIIAAGIVERLSEMGSGVSQDVSLLNRVLEADAVMSLIVQRPVIGWGLGVEFGFFDAIEKMTWVKNFAHNNFLSVWFKFGIVGLAVILTIWAGGLGRSWRLIRREGLPDYAFVAARVAGAALIGFALTNLTLPGFTTQDVNFTFATLLGLLAGLNDRTQTRLAQTDKQA